MPTLPLTSLSKSLLMSVCIHLTATPALPLTSLSKSLLMSVCIHLTATPALPLTSLSKSLLMSVCIRFTAHGLSVVPGSTPLYTSANPPDPTMRSSLHPLVAADICDKLYCWTEEAPSARGREGGEEARRHGQQHEVGEGRVDDLR